MAMAAACAGRWKILASAIMRRLETTRTVVVASTCINGQNERRWAVAEKGNYFIPHPRRYWTCARDMKRSSRSTGNYNYDLAVEKAIQHYHKHIKVEVEEEDGPSIMMYPVRGASKCISGVKMFHILLKTTGGQKYVSIYVAPKINHLMKLDDGALKLVFFRKVDSNVPLPFRKVVGEIRWPVSPRNDPLIMAAARFALAQHNKTEKLAHLIRANSQMVADYEIFRMTFKAHGSRMYDAIVLVPRNNVEKMELVMFGVSDGWGMYGRLISSCGSKLIKPHIHPVERYMYESEEEEEEEDEDDYTYQYQYEGDECVIDDPRVTTAARFALALYNKKDKVRLQNRTDQVRRVVEATRRTYSGDEILSMKFDGELDGSWFYQAIVLVPVNDPNNMRLVYIGRNYDPDDDDDDDEYEDDFNKVSNPVVVNTRFHVYGFDECNIDDPRVTEVAQFALAEYYRKDKRKDKLLRVVKAISQNHSRGVTYRVRFVGEDNPLRTYVAMVSIPVEHPQHMQVEHVCPEVCGPSRQYAFPEVSPKVKSNRFSPRTISIG